MRLSTRLDDVQPSLTLSISAKAARYRAAGRDVISLSAGEPDFPPPRAVEEAALTAVREHKGRYTPVSGTTGLRAAIAAYLERAQGLRYPPDSIIVTSGAKQALFNALYAICDEGDEVIIPAPYWTSYPEMARALGVRPVIAETDPNQGFRLDPDAIERLVTPRTRMIILNSPSNPTGGVLSREELEGIAEVVRRHDLWVLSDDIYDRLIFDGSQFLNLPMVAPDLWDRTVVVNGLSKTFCMTGWRVGYAAGPAAVISMMEKIQSHSTSCASAISQLAGQAGLAQDDGDQLRTMLDEYARRAAHVHTTLSAVPGVRCAAPRATFYAFPIISELLGRSHDGRPVRSALDMADLLLEESNVAVVPGEAFGFAAGIRLSFATSFEEVAEGCGRISAFLTGLS